MSAPKISIGFRPKAGGTTKPTASSQPSNAAPKAGPGPATISFSKSRTTSTSTPKPKPALSLGDDDDEEDKDTFAVPSSSKASKAKAAAAPLPVNLPISRLAKRKQEEAQKVDASVYEYDEVYDKMKEGARLASEKRKQEAKEDSVSSSSQQVWRDSDG